MRTITSILSARAMRVKLISTVIKGRSVPKIEKKKKGKQNNNGNSIELHFENVVLSGKGRRLLRWVLSSAGGRALSLWLTERGNLVGV